MIKQRLFKIMVALMVGVLFAGSAGADLVGQLGILDLDAVPINPATGEAWVEGDAYHLVYVTTGTTDALSDDIADYNAFVQADADAEGMGVDVNSAPVSWYALGSTTTDNAIDNAVITGPVLAVFDSGVVATDSADLWDFQWPDGNPIAMLDGGNSNIWTGTGPGGVASGGNELGAANETTRRHWTGWTDWGPAFATEDSGNQREMVAISEELTVISEGSGIPLILGRLCGLDVPPTLSVIE